MKCPVCKRNIPNEALKCPYCKTRTGLLCSHCKTVNPVNALVCQKCGAELLKICPHCNSVNFPIAAKCRKCGSPLTNRPKIQKEKAQKTKNNKNEHLLHLKFIPQLCTHTQAQKILTDGLRSKDKKIFSIV